MDKLLSSAAPLRGGGDEFAEDLLAEHLRSGAAQWRDGRLVAQVPHHEPAGEGPLRAPWPRHWPATLPRKPHSDDPEKDHIAE
jgi:hypothetical protein